MCFEESERMQAVETSKAKNDRKHKERTTDSKVTIFFVVFQFLFLIKGNIWLQVTCAFWRGGGTYHEARKQLKRALVTVKSTVRLRSGGMSSCLRAVNMSRLKGAEQPCWQQCYWMVFNVVPPAKPPPLALMLGKRWAETAALKWKKKLPCSFKDGQRLVNTRHFGSSYVVQSCCDWLMQLSTADVRGNIKNGRPNQNWFHY